MDETCESLPTCSICMQKVYSSTVNGTRRARDHTFLRPCQCNHYVHHGCIANVVPRVRKCPTCSYVYHYRIYGKLTDYIRTHKFSLFTPICIYGTILVLSMTIVFLTIKEGVLTLTDKVLLFSLFLALIVATGVCICWGYFVYTIKFNKFQQRYAQISVQWYEGNSQMPKRFYSSYHFSTQAKEEPKDASDPTQKLLASDESDKTVAP
ncbi:hypothetical protein M3Y94_01145200 [Aphelenchoides besseyi]|nr:hypothetical protein M3Y94_01145200 [Aphelenchoides besseyi]KAI6227903.1 hypothetical protein M3Y95_00565800 [Aphelenchoides besseyi]